MLKDTLLYEYLENAKKLDENKAWVYAFSEQSIKDEIIRLIQDEQLQAGIDANGDIMGYYSLFTEWITNGRKQEGDPYTLEDTGAFYSSMFVKVGDDYFIVDADGQKDNENLFVKFGDDIIGLTDESIEKLNILVAEKYIEWLLQVGQLTPR